MLEVLEEHLEWLQAAPAVNPAHRAYTTDQVTELACVVPHLEALRKILGYMIEKWSELLNEHSTLISKEDERTLESMTRVDDLIDNVLNKYQHPYAKTQSDCTKVPAAVHATTVSGAWTVPDQSAGTAQSSSTSRPVPHISTKTATGVNYAASRQNLQSSIVKMLDVVEEHLDRFRVLLTAMANDPVYLTGTMDQVRERASYDTFLESVFGFCNRSQLVFATPVSAETVKHAGFKVVTDSLNCAASSPPAPPLFSSFSSPHHLPSGHPSPLCPPHSPRSSLPLPSRPRPFFVVLLLLLILLLLVLLFLLLVLLLLPFLLILLVLLFLLILLVLLLLFLPIIPEFRLEGQLLSLEVTANVLASS
ncbi:unnamed protein product [Schistocephalus solidus]|uniref:DHC_N1 domain-containing protein n=1 Tax=Schistocephalus solidus TaxID=70667 RepID=A0A183T1K0_SCHSO|nr:unnamed protein product [Schistocephalus solidus]